MEKLEKLSDAEITKIAEVFEKKFSATMKNHLEGIIEPYQQDKIEILEEEFRKAQKLFAEIESTLLGTFVIQRAVKKINKREASVIENNSEKK